MAHQQTFLTMLEHLADLSGLLFSLGRPNSLARPLRQHVKQQQLDILQRVILETSVKHPFSIAVFENTLYWSEWEDQQVASCHKFTGKDYKVLVRSLKSHIFGIKVYHPALHPSMENPCKDAGCSDICMLAPNNSYTCACPADKEVGFDQHSCRAMLKKEMVVAVAGSRIIQVEHRLLGRQTQSVMQAKSFGHINAVVYSSVDGVNPCERHRCSHVCAITPRGAECLCADGQIVGENVRCKNENSLSETWIFWHQAACVNFKRFQSFAVS